MKKFLTKNTLLNIYFFLFIFILVTIILRGINTGYPKDGWIITEFLINYQGGFVRRGLLGEIILQIYNITGLRPYTFIIILSSITFLLLIWFFIKQFIKNGYPIFFLPLVFFLGNPIINAFWVKKDSLIILIFILTIYFSIKKSKWHLILSNLFLIIGLLIHESIGFFCIPIIFLILISKNNYISNKTNRTLIKSIVISIFQLIPSIIAFFCVLYFKGSEFISNQIWNSWKHISFPYQNSNISEAPCVISSLSWTLKRSLLVFWDSLFEFKDNLYVPLVWLLAIIAIYYVLTNTSKLNFKILNYKPINSINKTNITNTLIIQFISIIPLFILGIDYGRWIFYWVISSFSIILLIPEKELAGIFPKIIGSIGNRTNNFLNILLGKSSVVIISLLIGFPMCGWDWKLYSCIYSNSILTVLTFTSNILYNIINFINHHFIW